MIFGRTVVVALAGEEIARYRVHRIGRQSAGRFTAPPDADFLLEAQRLLLMRGLSRDDAERAELRIED